VLKAQEAQQSRVDELVTRLSAPKQVDTFGARDMMTMQQQSQMQMIAMLGAMSQIFRPTGAATETNNIDAVLSTMQKMQALQAAMGGGDGGGGGSLLSTLAPLGLKFLDVVKSQQTANSQAVPALAAPQASGPAMPAAPLSNPQPEHSNVLFLIKDQLGQLAQLLAVTADDKLPLVAEQVLQAIPEQFDDQIYTIFSGANWYDHLTLAQPLLAPHRTKLEVLRAEILKSFEAEKPQ
jgi:hypothetical protein